MPINRFYTKMELQSPNGMCHAIYMYVHWLLTDIYTLGTYECTLNVDF